MSRRSPYRIVLTPEERSELERRARRQTATRREVFRAQIVVLAADGLRNDEIAERLGTVRTTVSRWRKRFFEDRSAGLFPFGWSSRSRPSCVNCPSILGCTGSPLLPHNGPIATRTAPDRNAAYVAVMWNRFRYTSIRPMIGEQISVQSHGVGSTYVAPFAAAAACSASW